MSNVNTRGIYQNGKNNEKKFSREGANNEKLLKIYTQYFLELKYVYATCDMRQNRL